MPGRVAAELTRALDKLRTGNARAPSLSPDIVNWLREAWLIASLEGGASRSAPATCWRPCWPTRRWPARYAKAAPSLLDCPADARAPEPRAIWPRAARKRARLPQRARRRAAPAARRAGRGAARRRAARPVLHRPDGAGQGRQDRPDPRPRRRDPADGRHPDAAPAEQPDPHRRGRRRQDRGGRGAGAAHRRGRRAGRAARA